MAHYPIRNLWVGTGNNPKMNPDMIRRTIRLRLDANMARPEYRSGFRHDNLTSWVESHLPELVGACLTMIQYWISKDQPLAPVTKGGGFDSWSQIMGGICSVLELDAPFLSNEKSALPGSQWVAGGSRGRDPLSLLDHSSRSVLAIKGSLRRACGPPLTAPGRSEAVNL